MQNPRHSSSLNSKDLCDDPIKYKDLQIEFLGANKFKIFALKALTNEKKISKKNLVLP
jgi:hypothetical protein